MPFVQAKASQILLVVPLVAAGLCLTGCGAVSQPISLTGNWTGTLTDALGHPGTASLNVTEDRHGILHGAFSYFASDCSADSEAVIGKVSGGQLSLSQNPSDPIPVSLQLSVDSSDQHLNGSYSASNGNCASSGTLALTKPY